MGQLTQTMIAQITNFRADLMAALTTDLGEGQAIDAISAAGALSLTRETTELTIAATLAFTLAAPTYVGQKKRIKCVAATSTPAGTVTLTSPDATAGYVCAGSFFFDTVGQEVQLEATSALAWRATAVKRVGGVADNVVIGTTVLTGKNMWKKYNCSVTGTVTSTTTMALPNGSAIGERIMIANTTAALTPIGTLDGVYTTGLAAAYTHAGAIGVVASATVTGDFALLEWNGASWDVMDQSGITFS